jgi:cardiolipin synthase
MNDKQAITPTPFRYIPNAMSWCRVGLAIAFPFSPEDWHVAIVVLAGLTEFLDGFLARAFRWTSYFGQVLDPVADKLFFLSVSLTFVWLGKLSLLYWLLLSIRDFGVLFIVIALGLTGRIRSVKSPKAELPSKITTGLQYAVVLAILFGFHQPVFALVLVAAVIGVLATIQYVIMLWMEMQEPASH